LRPHLPAFTKEPKGKHFLDETCFATTFMRYKEQRQINLLIWSIKQQKRMWLKMIALHAPFEPQTNE
jgi:hypothetical protein